MTTQPLRMLLRQEQTTTFIDRSLAFAANRVLHRFAKQHIDSRQRQVALYAFDHIGHQINLYGIYERSELTSFIQWTKSLGIDFSDSTIVDVGANIGNHSLFFSDHFNRVMAFEPHPRTFKLLEINASLAKNIDVFEVGLSDRADHSQLSINETNMGGCAISTSHSPHNIDIQLSTLDHFETIENLKLIKIDAENHELQVISGGAHTIRTFNPIILFEQQGDAFSTDGISPVVEMLMTLGYRSFATLSRIPNSSISFLRSHVLDSALRMAFGERVEIVVHETIEPRFHSFVAALPDWVVQRLK